MTSITRLTPSIDIDGKQCLLMTPQLAGIARSALRLAASPVSEA